MNNTLEMMCKERCSMKLVMIKVNLGVKQVIYSGAICWDLDQMKAFLDPCFIFSSSIAIGCSTFLDIPCKLSENHRTSSRFKPHTFYI